MGQAITETEICTNLSGISLGGLQMIDRVPPVNPDEPACSCATCGAVLLEGERGLDDGLCFECWLKQFRGGNG
jgi:hypothetical protein